MDVSRPQKQVGLDSGFNSGLTVVSLKKKEKEKRKEKMERLSETIHRELLQQVALCCLHHWMLNERSIGNMQENCLF